MGSTPTKAMNKSNEQKSNPFKPKTIYCDDTQKFSQARGSLEIYMKLPILLTCEAPEGAETRELTLLLRALLENRET